MEVASGLYCGLCKPLDSGGGGGGSSASTEALFWQAKAPTNSAEAQKRQFILQANLHETCVQQARDHGLLVDLPVVEYDATKEEDEGASFFKTHLRPPAICFSSNKLDLFSKPLVTNTNRHMEVPLQAQQGFACGFRLFPQVHPPRTLEDLLQCTSVPFTSTRLCESSLVLPVKAQFPEMFKTLVEQVPMPLQPKSKFDALWQQQQQPGCDFKLRICSQGCSQMFRVGQFRTCQVSNADTEWGVLDLQQASKALQLSQGFRSKLDFGWIPDLCFLLRNRISVNIATTTANQLLVSAPGSATWAFFKQVGTNICLEWRFAERSFEAFKFVLEPPPHVERYPWDVKPLELIHTLLLNDLAILPLDLRSAMQQKLQSSIITSSSGGGGDGGGGDGGGEVQKTCSKSLCDVCHNELFHRYVVCGECKRAGEDSSSPIVLEALYPLSRQKKDRSVLPDCFRSGCRVLVNLTVSGNSNDRPPRQIGASYLPGILLKTGHGFFTVYLEGSRETVVKRRAALDRHPSGTGLPNGYVVMMNNTNPDDMPPGTTCTISKMLPAYRVDVFCHECFAIHRRQHHASNNDAATAAAVYVDQRAQVLNKDMDKWNQCPSSQAETGAWPMRNVQVVVVDCAQEEAESTPRYLASVSEQAAANAMSFAHMMGPSPYATNRPMSPPNSPPLVPIKVAKAPTATAGALTNSNNKQQRSRADSAAAVLWENAVSLQVAAAAAVNVANGANRTVVELANNVASTAAAPSAARKKARAASVNYPLAAISATGSSSTACFTSVDPPLIHPDLPTLLRKSCFLVESASSSSTTTSNKEDVTPAFDMSTRSEELQSIWQRASTEVPRKRLWSFLT